VAISIGQHLGPYEVLSAIGAGGMGEVYRARDTRLDRIVAIKVLPPHLANKPELRERFEREARTIASLNHPHICTLYDIGQQDGVDFLVMEYLQGETLEQRLVKGRLTLGKVLQYAIEIADALDKAHRKGITHRDLKPGNIMLLNAYPQDKPREQLLREIEESRTDPTIDATRQFTLFLRDSGYSKLLDFGLAKLKQDAAPAAPVLTLSQLPTMKSAVTHEGTILGTLQYMAPEQVEGKVYEVDARTDIFAFGAVVYEMATGEKAFEGDTPASVMAKILETDPPSMASLQPMTPPALDHVVKTCLAKNPEQRWQTARDLELELKWIAEGGSQISSVVPVPAKGIRALGRSGLFVGVGALLLVAVIASLATWNLKPAPPSTPKPVSRLTITLPPGQQLAGLNDGPAVALSPDGTHLAYVARQGGIQQIYLRALDSLEAKPILGTDGAANPFFSPDGQWLGFFAAGKLKKVSVSGGAALTLGDALFPRGASWGSQGMIAFAPTFNGVLQQVSDAGGTPQPLTRLEKGDVAQRWPEFLPGGEAVLFAAGTTVIDFTNAQVAVQVRAGERRNLVQGGTHPRYAPSGHLVFAQGGSLMAVPFDPQRLTATGGAVPVVEGVLQSTISGAAQYSFSATGSLVYVSGVVQSAQSRPVWVSRNGAEQPLSAPVHAYLKPRLSPDGRRIAVEIEGQVWLYDLSRETLTRFTFEGLNAGPVWTPDGKRIAFGSNREGPFKIFWQLADGSGELEQLTSSEYYQFPISSSPDGQLLTFMEVTPTTGIDIWVLRMKDPSAGPGQVRKAQPFLRTRFNESAAHFSPDGRWLAYMSDESGRWEIYVQPYPGPGGKWQISTEGGMEPAWNPNGRELFYRSGDKMMAVEIATQPGFTTGKPRMLFEGRYELSPVQLDNYDVSHDGQRFLMLKPDEQTSSSAPTQINVVQNWFEELKQKVPVGKK